MNLAYHTAGVAYRPATRGSCLDPVFTKGCKNLGKGFVTLHPHHSKPSIACIQSGKHGICYPGGKSGYNLQTYLNA